MVPQFVAEAVSFKATDESGYDWPGLDEVRAVFSDLNPRLMDLVTAKYENVDRGDVEKFGPDERCIAPRPKCDQASPSFCTSKSRFGSWMILRFPLRGLARRPVMQTVRAFTIFYVTESAPGTI